MARRQDKAIFAGTHRGLRSGERTGPKHRNLGSGANLPAAGGRRSTSIPALRSTWRSSGEPQRGGATKPRQPRIRERQARLRSSGRMRRGRSTWSNSCRRGTRVRAVRAGALRRSDPDPERRFSRRIPTISTRRCGWRRRTPRLKQDAEALAAFRRAAATAPTLARCPGLPCAPLRTRDRAAAGVPMLEKIVAESPERQPAGRGSLGDCKARAPAKRRCRRAPPPKRSPPSNDARRLGRFPRPRARASSTSGTPPCRTRARPSTGCPPTHPEVSDGALQTRAGQRPAATNRMPRRASQAAREGADGRTRSLIERERLFRGIDYRQGWLEPGRLRPAVSDPFVITEA